jgi:hypothetical protein
MDSWDRAEATFRLDPYSSERKKISTVHGLLLISRSERGLFYPANGYEDFQKSLVESKRLSLFTFEFGVVFFQKCLNFGGKGQESFPLLDVQRDGHAL